MSRTLAQQRVLVTRPANQGDGLVTAIEARGGRAWHLPLLSIAELDDPQQRQQCKQLILELDSYQHVIFISTNAVAFGVEWIQQYWPQWPVGIHWHGIGRGTCRAMREAGLPVADHFEAAHPMNSEALLQDQSLQSVAGQKVLIVKGLGGRDLLQRELQSRGASVDSAACYQRGKPDLPADQLFDLIQGEHIGTICINSGDTLENLVSILGERLREILSLRLIVPSQRVSALAREYGFTVVTCADNASDQAVLAALEQAPGQ